MDSMHSRHCCMFPNFLPEKLFKIIAVSCVQTERITFHGMTREQGVVFVVFVDVASIEKAIFSFYIRTDIKFTNGKWLFALVAMGIIEP